MRQWHPLIPAAIIRDPARFEALVAEARRLGGPEFDEAHTRKLMADELDLPIWKNWLYQVAVRTTPTGMERGDGFPGTINLVHLSIKTIDRKPARDWRELQLIKNQMIGPECEAIELFPAESRLVDIANQTHLWGFDDPTLRFPFGFRSRVVSDTVDPAIGHKQRRFK